MKLGIFSWFGYMYPLKKRLKLIVEAGFTGTTLWWEDEAGEKEWKVPRWDMVSMVQDQGLYLENVHLPYYLANDLWSYDEKTRNQALKKHLLWAEECASLGVPTLVMHLANRPLDTPPHDTGVKCLQTLLDFCASAGMYLAFENTHQLDYMDWVLSLDPKTVGICLDTSHYQLALGSEHTRALSWRNRIGALHLSDNDGVQDLHQIPGLGVLDWSFWMKLLPRDYQGYLHLEILPKDTKENPKRFLGFAYASAKRLWELWQTE